jgi:hypothetical protein
MRSRRWARVGRGKWIWALALATGLDWRERLSLHISACVELGWAGKESGKHRVALVFFTVLQIFSDGKLSFLTKVQIDRGLVYKFTPFCMSILALVLCYHIITSHNRSITSPSQNLKLATRVAGPQVCRQVFEHRERMGTSCANRSAIRLV